MIERMQQMELMSRFHGRDDSTDGHIPEPASYDNRIKRSRSRAFVINREYFDDLMGDHNLSLRALAAKMGLNHGQLSQVFSGARRAQIDEVAQLSNILEAPVHRIIENLGVATVPVVGRRVPVIGYMGADGVVKLHNPDALDQTTAPDGLPDHCVAIQYRTSGTSLEWIDGDMVFCRENKGRRSIDPEAMGRCCLAKIRNGPVIIGSLRRGYQEYTFNAIGPYVKESAAIEWATPLLLTRH